MPSHRLTFLHEVVHCKDCGQPITAEQWSRDESCPGRPFKVCDYCQTARADVRYRALPEISGGTDLCRDCWLDVQGVSNPERTRP